MANVKRVFGRWMARSAGVMLAAALGAGAALAAEKSMTVSIDGLKNKGRIAGNLAFCIPAEKGHVQLGPNKSPAIKWAGAPKETKSFAIVALDTKVPSVADNVNKEGVTIPATLARARFFHWVLIDIPATTTGLALGADSNGVTAKGKAPGPTPNGTRGINDYTQWFASDKDMNGKYGGYDGPCPPWNDQLVHQYHFNVYALDVPSLGMSGAFTGPQALAQIRKHTLARASIVGTYTLNANLRGK